jgi:hypothetical protein
LFVQDREEVAAHCLLVTTAKNDYKLFLKT